MNIFQEIAFRLADNTLYEYIAITGPVYIDELTYYSESAECFDPQDLIRLRYWLINQKIVCSILLKLLEYLDLPIDYKNSQFLRDPLILPAPDDYYALMGCDDVLTGEGLRGTKELQTFFYHTAGWTVHDFYVNIDSWSEYEQVEILKQLKSYVPRSSWKLIFKEIESAICCFGSTRYTLVFLHYTSKIDRSDIENIYSRLAFFSLHIEKEDLLLYIIPQKLYGNIGDECFDFSSMDPYGAFYAFYKSLKEPLLLPGRDYHC